MADLTLDIIQMLSSWLAVYEWPPTLFTAAQSCYNNLLFNNPPDIKAPKHTVPTVFDTITFIYKRELALRPSQVKRPEMLWSLGGYYKRSALLYTCIRF